ncbi:tail protein X [Campylobacter lari]|uniref:tail protein X n=1 Tax=Campylobacter TaxID=194 RepID=UPI0010779260|nr:MULTISPECIES: tail protein X [Campylobacter]EAI7174525.1 phage tail protein [Campylobacter coli]EAC1839728.1 phage tail protein [Campylobacter lari]EAH6869430.1 phage tail protein [Campylobacter lari]EAH7781068.1 phage tail protein [Campylobacter lari]EAH8420566.1 phage tail protein [Campylobacter lari]
MSKIYIAKDGEKLDSIVYKHYGTLEYFDQVLMVNPKLEPLLKTGDKIVLPVIKQKESKEDVLW